MVIKKTQTVFNCWQNAFSQLNAIGLKKNTQQKKTFTNSKAIKLSLVAQEENVSKNEIAT